MMIINRSELLSHGFIKGRKKALDIATTLKATGDAVITGPTGTNVNDLVVCVVL